LRVDANRCGLESRATGAGVCSEPVIGAPIGVVGRAPIWMPVGRDGVGTRQGGSIQRVGGGVLASWSPGTYTSPLLQCNGGRLELEQGNAPRYGCASSTAGSRNIPATHTPNLVEVKARGNLALVVPQR
jgi:hypothetical protein